MKIDALHSRFMSEKKQNYLTAFTTTRKSKWPIIPTELREVCSPKSRHEAFFRPIPFYQKGTAL